MSSSVVADTCRITVISSQLRADLAVPATTTVAELLATLVSSLGREAADDGAANGGWILQRAAERPLELSSTLSGANVRDGDILHLRTRSSQLPEIAYDDVLDAVASGVLTRTARWNNQHTLIASIAFAVVAVVLTLATALLTGPTWLPSAVVSGVAVLLLGGAAIALTRGFSARGAGIVAAAGAVGAAVVCGATSVGGDMDLFGFGAPQLLLGACAAVFVAILVILLVGSGIPGFTAVATAGALAGIGTAVASGTHLSATAVASLVAAVGLAVSPFFPIASFRMSRLPLPSIPNDAADLRRDTSTVDAPTILRQATLADQFLTGLVGGVSLAIAGAAVILAFGQGSQQALAIVLSLICLLRARLFTGRAQRALLLVSGTAAAVAVLVRVAGEVHGPVRIGVIAGPTLLVAILMFFLAVTLPGRRYAPTMARMADILESLLVLSVIPLALGVMGVYGAIRRVVSK